MGQRSSNRKGWSGNPGDVGPDELNAVYSFGQEWIPAGAMTPHSSDGAKIEQFQFPAANAANHTVARFRTGVENEVFFNFAFKSGFQATSLALKFKPVFFVDNIGNEGNTIWSVGAVNANLGSNINIDAETTTDDMTIPGPDTIYDFFSGTGADPELAFDLGSSFSPDNIHASNTNVMSLLMERHGENVNDTLDQDVFLFGVMIQWATDFNNLAVWPT